MYADIKEEETRGNDPDRFEKQYSSNYRIYFCWRRKSADLPISLLHYAKAFRRNWRSKILFLHFQRGGPFHLPTGYPSSDITEMIIAATEAKRAKNQSIFPSDNLQKQSI